MARNDAAAWGRAVRWTCALGALWLGAASALADEARFVETGVSKGLPAERAVGRAVFCDLDGDGWADVVLNHQELYRNVVDPAGGRRFVAEKQGLGLAEGTPGPVLSLFADLDHDGDKEAILFWSDDPKNPKAKPDTPRARIWWQVRPWEFVADPTPLPLPREAFNSGGLFDGDRDGWLDLVTGSSYQAGGPVGLEAFPVHLLRGRRRGFRDVTRAAGLGLRVEPGHADSRRPIYGVSFADLNGDGAPEILFCAYGRQRNLLYLNQGDGTYREIGQETGFAGDADQSGRYSPEIKAMFKRRFGSERQDEKPFRSNGNSFDAPAADFDNDGDLDLFVGEITHAWAGPSSDRSSLLVNEGAPLRFRRRVDAAPRAHAVPNWNQGDLHTGWLDADNDGHLDLLIASGEYPDDQRLRLFRQGPPGVFRDVSDAFGLRWDVCTGLSLADYDHDGDVDILVGNSNRRLPKAARVGRVLRPGLFENRASEHSATREHAWLNVRLIGAGPEAGGANRDALGAQVVVHTADGRRLLRHVSSSLGHAGHRDALSMHFGLGAAKPAPVDVEIRWPSARSKTTRLRGVTLGQTLVVKER